MCGSASAASGLVRGRALGQPRGQSARRDREGVSTSQERKRHRLATIPGPSRIAIAFAFLHTEMGDLARAEQLSARSEPFNNVLLALAVRKRLGLPAVAATGVESMLERFAFQPGLLEDEHDRWTPGRTTHLA